MTRNMKLFILPLAFVPFAAALAQAAYAKDHTISHAQIVAEIQDRLYHAQVFKHGSVNVAFQDGTATLTGSVDCIGVKMDAENATRKVNDVNQVVNQITVNPGDMGQEGIIRQARKEILTYPFYTIFDNIVFRIQGNNLTVDGQVTDPYKKSDIGNFLEHIQGVTSLTNDLTVLPVSQFDASLRLAIARAIYDDPYFINYRNQATPPIHIIVDNGNVTLEGVVNSQIDKAQAERDARLAATYFGFKNNLRVESGK
ncbi:MAG TPA: BON domain-containing protein [Terriglobia bacterium]|nr:BON domain-containing protein [Terriglobia bacterium]